MKNIFDNPLRNQCMSIAELTEVQLEGALKGYKDSGVEGVLGNVKRVIMTGCGDSYFASMLAVSVFNRYCSRFGLTFMARRCIDVARYLEFGENNDNVLVVGVSASGGPARVAEALLRAKNKGCMTLALTNNPESRAAESAQYKFIVNTPAFPNASPGLRNYLASLSGLYVLAIKCGIAHGLASKDDFSKFHDALFKMNEAYAQRMGEYEDKISAVASKWYQLKSIEAIGNGCFNMSAAFVAAKFVEVCGTMTNVRNSNDFNQININYKDAETIGSIFYVNSKDDNLDDMLLAVRNALSTKRQVIVIANMDIDINCDKIIIPDDEEGMEFVGTMFNYLPGSLLAAYCAALQEATYFRGGIWAEPTTNTIRSSEIKIV